MPNFRRAAVFCAITVLAGGLALPTHAAEAPTHAIEERLVKALADHEIVGAQLTIGDAKTYLVDRCFGVTVPGGSRPVDSSTQFCIGSCSKAIAAAAILSVCDANRISLDQPVDRWLPAFSHVHDAGGKPLGRAPTLTELLTHRAGIYSQKQKITPQQSRAIRDFRLTLAESVDLIANEPLLSAPGEKFAYSGAGYCVAGRAVEVATGKPFEQLLQSAIGRPLGLGRTTYFPRPDDPNVARGGSTSKTKPAAPHVIQPMRLSLVGGSLYSTTHDMASFARMILAHGQGGQGAVVLQGVWERMVSLPLPGEAYGYGWRVNGKGKTPESLLHNGALFSYKTLFCIDLKNGRFLAATFTIPVAENENEESSKLLQVLQKDGQEWMKSAASQ